MGVHISRRSVLDYWDAEVNCFALVVGGLVLVICSCVLSSVFEPEHDHYAIDNVEQAQNFAP